MVRPRDLSAWLLLGLLLGVGETALGYPGFDDWGPAALKVVCTYYLLIYSAMPALLFLFGYFFPEPLPFFARAGPWVKWLPWIVVIPYEIYALGYVAVVVGGLTASPSTQWLGPIFDSVATPIVLYELALVVAFFVFIVTKSVIAVSTDAKRRLRLLYWGAARCGHDIRNWRPGFEIHPPAQRRSD